MAIDFSLKKEQNTFTPYFIDFEIITDIIDLKNIIKKLILNNLVHDLLHSVM